MSALGGVIEPKNNIVRILCRYGIYAIYFAELKRKKAFPLGGVRKLKNKKVRSLYRYMIGAIYFAELKKEKAFPLFGENYKHKKLNWEEGGGVADE